jgi:hypothetical protein
VTALAQNLQLDGSDFVDTIVEMGEVVTFKTDPEITLYASVAPHRTTNTTDGSYWYHGVMTFDSVAQQEQLIGEYFNRQTNPSPAHILTSVMPENTTAHMAEVYAVECNEKVDIISHYEKDAEPDEFGVRGEHPVYSAKNVDCYITVTQKPLSDQTSGAFIATITNLLIPAKYMLTQNNTVVKKGFVFNDKAKKTEYTDVEYTIESVDASMMDVLVDDDENEKYVGILRCTMTEKK